MESRKLIKRKIRQNWRLLKKMKCKYCINEKCDKRCTRLMLQTKHMELCLDDFDLEIS